MCEISRDDESDASSACMGARWACRARWVRGVGVRVWARVVHGGVRARMHRRRECRAMLLASCAVIAGGDP